MALNIDDSNSAPRPGNAETEKPEEAVNPPESSIPKRCVHGLAINAYCERCEQLNITHVY